MRSIILGVLLVSFVSLMESRMYYNQQDSYQGNSGSSQGSYGNQGNSGSYGNQGNSGSYGNQGNSGYSQGSYGSQGNSGYSQGSYGSQGNSGYSQGSYGSQGNSGYSQGSYGDQGTSGYSQGSYGNSGYNQGSYGNQGTSGYSQGSYGNQGNSGYSQGSYGNSGYNQGSYGDQGTSGYSQGSYGNSGYSSYDQSSSGNQGSGFSNENGPPPTFLNNVSSEAREEFFSIISNTSLTTKEINQKANKWAEENGVEEEYSTFESNRTSVHNQAIQNVSSVINNLAIVQAAIEDIQSNKSSTADQREAGFQELSEQYPMEYSVISNLQNTHENYVYSQMRNGVQSSGSTGTWSSTQQTSTTKKKSNKNSSR